MSQEILDRVRKVVVNALNVKEEEVVESASFQEDLGADSLDVVELAMALEEEFGITLEDTDFSTDTFATVQSIAEFVANKRG